jgi:hypothetical protein
MGEFSDLPRSKEKVVVPTRWPVVPMQEEFRRVSI